MGKSVNTAQTMYSYVCDGLRDISDDKTVIFFKGRRISKAKLFHDIDKFCSVLRNYAIGQGDVVTIHLPNIPDAAVAFYAVNKLGAIANLIHPLMPPLPLSQMVTDAGAKLLITFDSYYAANGSAISVSCPVTVCSASDYLPAVKGTLYRLTSEPDIAYTDRVSSFSQLMRKVSAYTGKPEGDPDSAAVYMYSGGTTGKPKTIALSHKAFNELTESLTYVISDYDPMKDVSLMVLPIFHGFGLGVCMHSMLSRGIESVMIPRYNTAEVLSVIARRKVTIIAGVPLMYKKMLGGGRAFRAMKGVKHIFCGGDKLTSALKQQFDAALAEAGSSACLLEGYGQTECVTVCCVNEPGEYVKGCLGYPLHGMKTAVIDDSGEFLPAGQTGEIVISAPTLMLGYKDADNSGVFLNKDGEVWLRSGDIGYTDSKGRLFFNDRRKSAEKISGVVVYPQEIAEVVGDLPFVSESYAVKVSEGDREYMRLYCVAEGDREEARKLIDKHLKDRLIVYARPKEIVFLDRLPRTAVGKIDTGALKKLSEKDGRADG